MPLAPGGRGPKSEIGSRHRVSYGNARHRQAAQAQVRTGGGSGNRDGSPNTGGTGPRALAGIAVIGQDPLRTAGCGAQLFPGWPFASTGEQATARYGHQQQDTVERARHRLPSVYIAPLRC
jgi:hypothetical protein